MSSFAARSHRICSAARPRNALPQLNVIGRRHLQSVPVPNTKAQGALFTELSSLPVFTSPLGPRHRGLPPKIRLRKFTEIYAHVQDRIGSQPAIPHKGVKHSSWRLMMQMASSREELELLIKLFPHWRESKRSFDKYDSELFIRRCVELESPDLALRVLTDHPHYGLSAQSYKGALHLIHALHLSHPLSDTITAAALLKVNHHPETTASLPACAMLTYAALKNVGADPRAKDLAEALLPALRKLCSSADPEEISKERFEGVGVGVGQPHKWAVDSLKSIEEHLRGEGKVVKWLEDARGKFKLPPRRRGRQSQAVSSS